MITAISQPTAKILQFPSRAALSSFGQKGKSKPATVLSLPRVKSTAFGSGWYHDAAIEDARKGMDR